MFCGVWAVWGAIFCGAEAFLVCRPPSARIFPASRTFSPSPVSLERLSPTVLPSSSSFSVGADASAGSSAALLLMRCKRAIGDAAGSAGARRRGPSALFCGGLPLYSAWQNVLCDQSKLYWWILSKDKVA